MDFELAETFYNSVTRRLFEVVGLDIEFEFLWLGPTTPRRRRHPRMSQLPVDESLSESVDSLEHSPLASQFGDIKRDVERVATEIQAELDEIWDVHRLDRHPAAGLLSQQGRLPRRAAAVSSTGSTGDLARRSDVRRQRARRRCCSPSSRPTALRHTLLFPRAVPAARVVAFLKGLLPVKPVAEVTLIEYSAHGKTNLFRALYRHMEHSNTRSNSPWSTRHGDGGVHPSVVRRRLQADQGPLPAVEAHHARGCAAALPVFDRDGVGRLVDAQEFTNLSFDRDRFDEDLIEELKPIASAATVTEDEVILHHVYTERRLYPLDLYLREMARIGQADRCSNAIKDIARPTSSRATSSRRTSA